MPLLTEVIRDVINHPENYAGAFPVSELVDEPINSYAQPPRGQDHRQEFMRWMEQQIVDRSTGFNGGLPQMFSTPFSRDDVASRILEESRRRVAPWGDGDGNEGRWQIYPTRTHDAQRMDYRVYGDGLARPDHYRVRGGECICGFRTIWQRDMAAHIDGLQVTDLYGVLRQWMRCECGESRLCRQVMVGRRTGLTFNPPPVETMPAPSFDAVYLCDDCCQRRGIR